MKKYLARSRGLKILLAVLFVVLLFVMYLIFLAPNPSSWAVYSADNAWIVTTNKIWVLTLEENFPLTQNFVLNIWNTQDGQHLAQVGQSDDLSRGIFTLDNRFLVRFNPNKDSGIHAYSTNNWERTENMYFPRNICEVTISHDAIYVMVCAYERNIVYVEELIAGSNDLFRAGLGGFLFETVSGEGESYLLLNQSFTRLFVALAFNGRTKIEIREIGSYDLLNNLQLDTEISAIEWLDDEHLIAADTSNQLFILDAISSEWNPSVTSPFAISFIDVSPDGKFLLAAGEGGTILYRIEDMQQLAILEPDAVASASFSPDGSQILIASSNIRQPYLEIDISEFILEQK